MDFLYANAKELIQSERIKIRVASLSLVCFPDLSVLARVRLISCFNIYDLFAGAYIILLSLSSYGWAGSLS